MFEPQSAPAPAPSASAPVPAPTPVPAQVPGEPRKYKDDDLVYVDPETRTVVGLVEWSKNDKPKSKNYVPPAPKEEPVGKDGKKKGSRGGGWHRKHYPWGTYRSMKRIYKLEGKMKDAEPNRTLEEVLPKALSQAFWND